VSQCLNVSVSQCLNVSMSLLCVSPDPCPAGQNCTYTVAANCGAGFACTYNCPEYMSCYPGAFCGSGPCEFNCNGGQSCQSTGFHCGTGNCDFSCLGGEACIDGSFFGGSAPMTLDCIGWQACDSLVVTAGTGPLTINCVGSGSCSKLQVHGSSGPLTISCTGPNGCDGTTVSCGSSICSISCGTAAGACSSFTLNPQTAAVFTSGVDYGLTPCFDMLECPHGTSPGACVEEYYMCPQACLYYNVCFAERSSKLRHFAFACPLFKVLSQHITKISPCPFW